MEPDMNMVWKRGQSFRIFTGDSKNESELWPSIVVDHFVLTNLFRSLVTKKETRRLVSEISEMSLCHWAHLRQCFNRQGTGCLVAFDSKGCLLQIWNSCDCLKNRTVTSTFAASFITYLDHSPTSSWDMKYCLVMIITIITCWSPTNPDPVGGLEDKPFEWYSEFEFCSRPLKITSHMPQINSSSNLRAWDAS